MKHHLMNVVSKFKINECRKKNFERSWSDHLKGSVKSNQRKITEYLTGLFDSESKSISVHYNVNSW